MIIEKRPCMNCHQNLATIKIIRLTDDLAQEEYLCRQCAAQKSPYQKKFPPQLDEILSGILGAGSQTPDSSKPVSELVCSTCGLPFSSYRETLILGCSDCYHSFEKLLVNDLKRFHGSIEHTGRVPYDINQPVEISRSPMDLQKRLNDAIAAEDFVLAAKLRDQLRITNS